LRCDAANLPLIPELVFPALCITLKKSHKPLYLNDFPSMEAVDGFDFSVSRARRVTGMPPYPRFRLM
jgi:hypothetical protein